MKHKVVITPHPIIEVETFAGKDVAEEIARGIFHYKYTTGAITLYDADHSDVEVMDVKS